MPNGSIISGKPTPSSTSTNIKTFYTSENRFDSLLFFKPWTLSPLCHTFPQNVLMHFTLRLCLYAASSTAGTKSSVGSPLSSARPGGYQDRIRTPGDTQKLKSLIIHPGPKTLVNISEHLLLGISV